MTSNSKKPSNQSNQNVIEVVRAHREVSRRIIAAETGLSTPSVTRLVNELVESGVLVVQESTTVDGAGPGRPASVVKLNPNFASAIGVDVGEYVIQAALGDLSGDIKLTSRQPAEAEKGGDETIGNIASAVRELLEAHSGSHGETAPLRAITVGVPGTVDPITSQVVKAPLICGWEKLALKEELESQFPEIEIRIVNDINAAAIGEYAHGVAQGCDNFVFASIRRGIGAGIFIDGQLYRGHAGFAGEMGKMVFDSAFRFSHGDGLGYLETTCGEDPIVERARQSGVMLEQSSTQTPLNVLATAAAAGDPEAVSILVSFTKEYSLAIANIASLLDPSIIVIGGDIHPAMELVLDQVNKSIAQMIPSPPKVVGSSLGDQASLHGTLYQAHKDACDSLLTHQTVS